MRRLLAGLVLSLSVLTSGTVVDLAAVAKTPASSTSSKTSPKAAKAAKTAKPKASKPKTTKPKTSKPKTGKPKTSKPKARPTTTASVTRSASYCETCARDSHGRILRGDAAKDAFKRQTGYAQGRPGYVIDHVVPLACGGQDSTANMQWQTLAESKVKDKIERKGCTK